ncbi:hypothetical protein HGRIS_002532 [Hohenbuehelia grisea]|uniref:Uncharacterized protein n=1 Tax=Hohenbuehelia grisea TaxID=104357 RepID=A0ABR3JLP4_9AGAR
MNIWGAKKSRISFNPEKELEDIRKSMNVLGIYEKRWRTAGRLYDMLNALVMMGDLPLPKPATRTKRRAKDLVDLEPEQSTSQPVHPSANWSSDSPSSAYTSLSYTSSRPGSGALSSLHLPSSSSSSAFSGTPPQQFFDFPTSSEELGRMPVYAGTNAEGVTYDSSLFANWAGLQTPDVVKTGFPPMPVEHSAVPMQHHRAFEPPVDPREAVYSNGQHPHSQASAPAPAPYPEQYASYSQDWDMSGASAGPVPPLPDQNYVPADGSNESDTIQFWSMLPAGFDFQQWSAYLANTGDLTQT